jgi:hypothetical protein
MHEVRETDGRDGVGVRAIRTDEGGTGGFAAFADGRRVSPAFPDPARAVAWLDANQALVAGALSRGWDVPSVATVDRYGKALSAAESEGRRRLDEAEDMARIISEANVDPESPAGVRARDALGRLAETSARCRDRLAGLGRLRTRLSEDPVSLFLPVGATVRMRTVARPESWAGERSSPPVPGTLGVVLGAAEDGREGAVKVAFLSYGDVAGGKRAGDLGRPSSLYLDADDLDLVEPGRFADGSPCLSVDFVETHRPEEGRDRRAMEMVVEANGAAWRLTRHREGGSSWVEPQGWESLSDLDFLVPVGEVPAAGPNP